MFENDTLLLCEDEVVKLSTANKTDVANLVSAGFYNI